VNLQQLESGARAVAISPDGSKIAIGLGVGRPQPHLNNEGAFNIFSYERRGSKITLKNEARPAKRWIREMRFSSDGDMCGCASDDSNVYVLGGSDFELRQTLTGLTGPATHLDFSSDGAYVQTTSTSSENATDEDGHELMFYDPRTGQRIEEPSKTRDVDWATFSLPFGWPVQGAWTSDGGGIEVNTVDRSPARNIIAVGDEAGEVRLYRYPSSTTDAPCRVYRGHSAHVTRVQFMANGRTLLTVGGRDRCVFQWEVKN
jgi:WD40 repeat protein